MCLLFYRLPYVNCPALKVRYGNLEKIEKGHAIISSNKPSYCVLGKRNIVELEIKEKKKQLKSFKVFHFRAIGQLSKIHLKC